MPAFSSRVLVSVPVVLLAFVAGMAVDALGHREARAQQPATTTLFVPEGGIVFRAPDGTPLARIARDAHGGTFELFQDGARVSAPASSFELHPNPYRDTDDPWARRDATPTSTRPGPGF